MQIDAKTYQQYAQMPFGNLLLAYKLPLPETEYRFHPKRRWRFDYAWPEHKVAVEYEGLVSRKSRHVTLTGYTKDCEKYSTAAVMGWKVIRYTALTPEETLAGLLVDAFHDENSTFQNEKIDVSR